MKPQQDRPADPAAVLFVRLFTVVLDRGRYMKLGLDAFGLWALMMLTAKQAVTDGFVSDAHLKREEYTRGADTFAGPLDDLETAGVIERAPDGWFIVEWLTYNKSVSAIAEERSRKAEASARANHKRWHVDKSNPSPDCPYCIESGLITPPTDSATETVGLPLQNERTPVERETETETEVETETERESIRRSPTRDPIGTAENVCTEDDDSERGIMIEILSALGLTGDVVEQPTRGELRTVRRALNKGVDLAEMLRLADRTVDQNPDDHRAYWRQSVENAANTPNGDTPPAAPSTEAGTQWAILNELIARHGTQDGMRQAQEAMTAPGYTAAIAARNTIRYQPTEEAAAAFHAAYTESETP